MKKLSLILVLAMVVSMFAFTATAEGTYSQSPMLDAKVESGELPPVEERLPENPAAPTDMTEEDLDLEIGAYGGNLRMVSTSVNWSDDVFIGMDENLLTARSIASGIYEPNIVESYEVSEDNKVFTFKLRKGLKWSDGVEVTMDDFKFAIENFVFNEELTPQIAAWMRDGGSSTGTPFTFTVIDDETFSLSFNESYGGFLVHISISGWKGYTDLLKPAHYLKQYHKDFAEECHGSLDAYYEFMAPIAAAIGYDDITADGAWVAVFNQIDCTNWECSDPTDMLTSVTFNGAIDQDMPNLYAWEMTSASNNYYYYERNPYYFKVDADGNQLPYLDNIQYKTVETAELLQMEIVTGQVDFQRANATIDNVTLYKENADAADIDVIIAAQHNHPTDVALNMNYGLNPDGTVKDDEQSQAWQEVINDIRFRKALTISIDAEELVDGAYKGFAEPYAPFGCTHDIDGANALLDEMGMVDIDDDGFRETPSGKKFSFMIWLEADSSGDKVTVCDLLREFWQELGLNVEPNAVESTYMSTATSANEVPCRTINAHTILLWFYQDWAYSCWGPLWQAWKNAGGLTGDLPEDGTFLEPPEAVKEFYLGVDSLTADTAEVAVNETLPKLIDFMTENLYLIMPIDAIQKCVVVNKDLGNVPTGGMCIARAFALETLYFKTAE
ncbi:MAG: ABC transporter substrate-binding protein [Eubacteriales bacterium]|nr:ABC transporter substrate-binding protein [Eubacteriales bacterium]